MVAIVTDVHYRMSLALIRELDQSGVEVITCEREGHRDSRSSPALGALSRHASRHVWLPEEGYLEGLWELCREIDRTGQLSQEDRQKLLALSQSFLKKWQEKCGG